MGNSAAGVWQQVHDGLSVFIGKRVENDHERDDILQEVFLRVHQNLERLEDPERLLPWVYQITRHVIIDYYRSPKRHRELPAGLVAELQTDALVSSPEQDNDAKAELASCLKPMINRLSVEYSDAIRLVELEGLTHKQAAVRLGLSVPGVKSRVQRGRQQLRKLLDDCCIIELDRRRGVAGYEPRPAGQCY